MLPLLLLTDFMFTLINAWGSFKRLNAPLIKDGESSLPTLLKDQERQDWIFLLLLKVKGKIQVHLLYH